jgi:predicted transcriptional regulator
MLLQPLDITLAYKGVSLHPDLSAGDKLVAAAIIDHFNHKTSQCDPSLDRLAGLLGISRRTVIRSIQQLEINGLFRKRRHGGHLNRNSYEPVWVRFRELEAKWNARFNANSKRSKLTTASPSGCQGGHHDGDGSVTQTLLINPSKQPCLSESAPTKRRSPSTWTGRKWQANEEGRRAARDYLAPSGPGGRSRSPQEAALIAAERRWSAALHDRYAATPEIYGEIIDAIDVAMQSDATEAEMRRPGAGFTHILEQLQAKSMLISVQPAGAAGRAQPTA